MAVFGDLPFEGFHSLLPHVYLSLQVVRVCLQALNGLHGLFESFTHDLLFLLSLERFLVFLASNIPPDCSLRSKLCQFFVLRHTPTLAD